MKHSKQSIIKKIVGKISKSLDSCFIILITFIDSVQQNKQIDAE